MRECFNGVDVLGQFLLFSFFFPRFFFFFCVNGVGCFCCRRTWANLLVENVELVRHFFCLLKSFQTERMGQKQRLFVLSCGWVVGGFVSLLYAGRLAQLAPKHRRGVRLGRLLSSSWLILGLRWYLVSARSPLNFAMMRVKRYCSTYSVEIARRLCLQLPVTLLSKAPLFEAAPYVWANDTGKLTEDWI